MSNGLSTLIIAIGVIGMLIFFICTLTATLFNDRSKDDHVTAYELERFAVNWGLTPGFGSILALLILHAL